MAATKEASNKSKEGTIRSASSSDLREMRAQRSFLGTKTLNYPNSSEVHAQLGMCQCNRGTLTDITSNSIAPYNKFTASKELIIWHKTLGLWRLDTMSKCKPESTGIGSYELEINYFLTW